MTTPRLVAFICLAFFVLCNRALAQQSLDELLPPPEVLIGFADEISLEPEQMAFIREARRDGSRRVEELDREIDGAEAALRGALRADELDVALVDRHSEALIRLESEKRLIIIRTRTRMNAVLSTDQRAIASSIVSREMAARDRLELLVREIRAIASEAGTESQRSEIAARQLEAIRPLVRERQFSLAVIEAERILSDLRNPS